MQIFPSHVPIPRRLTRPGISCVANSSSRWRMPCSSRNPTMILGTPSRNDCAQNLSSFRSYLSIPLWLWISADVLSSTQFMGLPFFSGLTSQTILQVQSEYVDVDQARIKASISYLRRPPRRSQAASSLFQSWLPSNIELCCSQ